MVLERKPKLHRFQVNFFHSVCFFWSLPTPTLSKKFASDVRKSDRDRFQRNTHVLPLLQIYKLIVDLRSYLYLQTNLETRKRKRQYFRKENSSSFFSLQTIGKVKVNLHQRRSQGFGTASNFTGQLRKVQPEFGHYLVVKENSRTTFTKFKDLKNQ